ncbi:IclR family transcriptional regulator [Sinomonas terrae]|uniref:IclR family transcriptional regulator n=1 Tax=Sinomonas terrae TaxID=2908838 RepID=A0ABS9U4S0_9MICC|nr:IclR family transcriptional regulator [Sinomonas terrae]MCH6471684.1 IclR family transcriptional regulator [Sinomonas terrae]
MTGPSPISNAVAVLRCFSVDEPLLGVTDIAARVGLHKSSVSRILAILEAEGLVERDEPTRRFRLGLGIIGIAGPLLADLDERRVAYPALRELAERTGETSALLLWNGSEAVSVEQIPSRHQVKHTTTLGTRYATTLSASVQVFLAAETAERVREALGGTDDELEAYLARLAEVSERGYAVNYGETSSEEVGVAAPVYDHRGEIVAAVLISAPRFRISPEQVTDLGKACAETAAEVTRRLGGAPRTS